jgi:hypothetical protein
LLSNQDGGDDTTLRLQNVYNNGYAMPETVHLPLHPMSEAVNSLAIRSYPMSDKVSARGTWPSRAQPLAVSLVKVDRNHLEPWQQRIMQRFGGAGATLRCIGSSVDPFWDMPKFLTKAIKTEDFYYHCRYFLERLGMIAILT